MNDSLLSDRALVARYLKGDENAFLILFNRHKNKIYSFIYMMVRDKYIAEDLFQDTWIKVVDKLHARKYLDIDRFSPWVTQVSRNLCIDYFRKVKRTPTITTKDGTDIFALMTFADPNAEQKMVKTESDARVRQLIDRLPEDQREVLLMRQYANLSFKEISALINVNLNTTVGRMRYALINMRKMIAEHQIAM